MASDKPDYRVPSPTEKYRPGGAYYYYYWQGNSNFLPDLNHYVGMNFMPETLRCQTCPCCGRTGSQSNRC